MIPGGAACPGPQPGSEGALTPEPTFRIWTLLSWVLTKDWQSPPVLAARPQHKPCTLGAGEGGTGATVHPSCPASSQGYQGSPSRLLTQKGPCSTVLPASRNGKGQSPGGIGGGSLSPSQVMVQGPGVACKGVGAITEDSLHG